MRYACLIALALTACVNQGRLVDDPISPVIERDPVDAVVMGEALRLDAPNYVDHLQIGDINADGHVDMVMVNGGDGLYWFRGDGTGDMTGGVLMEMTELETRIFNAMGIAQTAEPRSMYIQSMTVADMDQDGRSDLVLTVAYQMGAVHYTASGALLDPTFFALWLPLWQQQGFSSASVVGDMDGDGRPELAILGESSSIVTSRGENWPLEGMEYPMQSSPIALMDPATGPAQLVLFVDYAYGITEIRSWSVTGNGLEENGVLTDLYAASVSFGTGSTPSEALLVISNGVGRFDGLTLTEEVSAQESAYLYNMPTGDLDGDGFLDALLSYSGTEEATLFASAPEGPLTPIPYTGPNTRGYNAQIADLNEDGLGDLIIAKYDPEEEGFLLDMYLNISDEQ